MHGFVYRQYSPARGLLYNGDTKTLKFCYDPEEAEKRWNRNRDYMTEIEINMYADRFVKASIPLRDEEGLEWIEAGGLIEFMSSKNIDVKVRRILSKVIEQYHFVKGGYFVPRSGSSSGKMDSENMEKIQAMRDVIEGKFRISPVKINISKNRDQKEFYDWNIGADAMGVEYEVAGRKYKTNFFGLYRSQFRSVMFPKHPLDPAFYGDHTLQYWQREARLRAGYSTLVNASRGAGKSYLMRSEVADQLFRERVFRQDFKEGIEIQFFGKNKEVIRPHANAIVSMIEKLLGDEMKENIKLSNFVKWDTYGMILYMYDGSDDTERRIRFISEKMDETRGLRPSFVCIDEYASVADGVKDTVLGYGSVPLVGISTIKAGDVNNVFWKDRTTAWAEGLKSVDVSSIIHNIRRKYGFHKAQSREDIYRMINEGVFEKARGELYGSIPNVGLRYTIDDIEYKTEQEKKLDIDRALSQGGEEYLLAEYYGEMTGHTAVFSYQASIDNYLPETFQKVYVGYDHADQTENSSKPGLICVGVNNFTAYVYREQYLPEDIDERYDAIKKILAEAKEKSRYDYVKFCADVGRGGDALIREIKDRVGKLDLPMERHHTSKVGINPKQNKVVVGKSYMVNTIQSEFFKKGNVRIMPYMEGLIEELGKYREMKGTFRAPKGENDDLVSAMLMALTYSYIDGVRDFIITGQDDMSQEDFARQYKQMSQNARSSSKGNPVARYLSM